jgi:versiconal hemiacetal acetate esterase
VEEMQGQFAALSAVLSASKTPPDDFIKSKDVTADGIPVRIYKPKDASRTKLPIMVYYHGGGFVLGNLDTEDAWCRYLAKTTPSIVVSVDYRLGPKFKMPVMLEDSLTAFKWVCHPPYLLTSFYANTEAVQVYANAETLGGTKSRIFTAGTSAGGSLALLVTDALIQEGKNSHVKGVITAVPITAHPLSIPEEYKSQYTSYERNGSGVPVADASTLNTFFEAAGCKYDDPMTFVTLSQNLSQFPPTYISTCGKDPLRDDGRVLEAMLKREGVKTKSDNYIGQPHCFWLFPNVNGEEFLANVVKGAQWVVLNSE